jgi:hypothetical protein
MDPATEHLGDQDLELVRAALVIFGNDDIRDVLVERRQVTHAPIIPQEGPR